MKSRKELETFVEHGGLRTVIVRADSNKDLPFLGIDDLPNNWLRLHGYVMRRNISRRCK